MIKPLIPPVVDRKAHLLDSFSRASLIEPLILPVVDRKAHLLDSFR